MNVIAPYIRRVPILASLPVETQIELEKAGEEKTYRRRQIIFMDEDKNEHIFLLVNGRVKLVRNSSNGREITLGIVNPLEFFGETGLLEHGAPYGINAEVLEDATVVMFPRRDFAGVIEQSSESIKEFAILQQNRRIQAEDRLTEYIFFDVPTRIARLLSLFATSHGRSTMEGGALIRMKLTHQEIANLVGSTRETTTVILNDFRRRGLIEMSGRKIIVCNQDALAKVAQ